MTPDRVLTLLSFSVSYAPTLHGERPARRGDWGRPPWPTGCAVRILRCNHILLGIVQWLDQIQLRPWGLRGTRGTHSTYRYSLVSSSW